MSPSDEQFFDSIAKSRTQTATVGDVEDLVSMALSRLHPTEQQENIDRDEAINDLAIVVAKLATRVEALERDRDLHLADLASTVPTASKKAKP